VLDDVLTIRDIS